MKILIVLRGQVRFYELTSKLLLHSLRNDDNVDFRILLCFNNTKFMPPKKLEKQYHQAYLLDFLSESDKKNVLSYYDYEDYNIIDYKLIIEKILNYNKNIDKLNKFDILYFANNLSQFYTYVESRKLTRDYIKKNNWHPDLVINARFDSLHYIENEHKHYKLWKNHLDTHTSPFLLKPEFSNRFSGITTYIKNIEYFKNIMWVDDLIFYEKWDKNFDNYEFFDNFDENIMHELLFHHELYHTIWPHFIFKNDIIRSIPEQWNTTHDYVTLRSHIYEYKDVIEKINSSDMSKNLAQEIFFQVKEIREKNINKWIGSFRSFSKPTTKEIDKIYDRIANGVPL